MLKIIKGDPGTYNTTEPEIKSFEKKVIPINATIMSGKIYNLLIGLNFNKERAKFDEKHGSQAPQDSSISQNKDFQSYFLSYLKDTLAMILESFTNTKETNERYIIPKLLSLFGLYRKLFPNEERDLWRDLWYIHQK